MVEQSEFADSLIRRYDQAETDRGTLDAHLEEIAQRVLPHYSGSFTGKNMQRTEGQKRTEEMVDASAALALTRFAAAFESMNTPRNSRWHRCVPSDKKLLRNRAVRLWFEDATDALFKYRYAPKANYASQQHEIYLGLGAFGTGALFVDALKDPTSPRIRGLRYRAIHLGEIYFLENHQGIIDTALRKFELTARQAEQKFGKDKLPEKILNALADADSTKKETKFWFIHCVKPRTEAEGYDHGRMDLRGMPFASYHVSIEGKAIVKEGGYNTFPYAISRYVVAPGELYGRSPAMMALPSIKVLNEQKKTVLKQGHRAVDPVLLAHDDGVVDGFSMKPGAVNYGGVSADGKLLVQALPVGNLTLAKEMMDAERAVINDFFLITLFQILIDSPQMTATEVLERAREKGALLSPTMGRQQSEALGPMIEREMDLLAFQGLLEPMPQYLRDAAGEFEIEYDSPLSRAQKAEEASGLMRLVNWASEYIKLTGDPSPLDHIEWDTAMPDLAYIHAVPTKWMRSIEKVIEIREGRAQEAQEQKMIEAAPAAAGLMKAMPQAA
jgi:hypothetical protein